MKKVLFALCTALVLAAQPASADSDKLAAVLAAQPDEAKARYEYRHPQETIEFFGIEPGMTVVEGLPGGGWYSKILLPYLGSDGHLVGARPKPAKAIASNGAVARVIRTKSAAHKAGSRGVVKAR